MDNIQSLKFNYTPNEIKKIANEYIKTDKDALVQLKKIKNPEEFLNLYLYKNNGYDYVYQVIVFLKDVSPDARIRKASSDFHLKISKYAMSFYKSSEYYNLLKNMFAEVSIPPKLIYRLLKPFKENGAHLSTAKKHIFSLLNNQLLKYENQFSDNIANDIHEIKYKRGELDGIDDRDLKDHFLKRVGKQNPESIYLFKTTYPDQTIILQNCTNPESRKKMHYAFNNVALENLSLLKKIIIIRQKLAKLLGYKNTVEYVLRPNERIATLPKIQSLIKKLTPILQRKMQSEIQDINKIFNNKNSDKLLSKNQYQINDYDLIYYSNQYKKTFLDLDSNIIKQYFPCSYTIPEIMDIFAELFGLKFQKIKASKEKYWNPCDIDLYTLSDYKTTELLGYLYLDLYPRKGKYTHAATFELQNSYYNGSNRIIPITAMVCNFSKDYLLFGEVTTFCHELGHAIHSLVTKVKYEKLSGISMEMDFVEMPSQLFENWCFNESFLKKISKHFKTHKPLDNKTIKNIILNKEYNCGIQYLTQLLYARYDLEVHMQPMNKITNKYLYQKWFDLIGELKPIIKSSTKIHPMCRFGHIAGGYNVGYYGYLWSNIYAYDVFSIFENKGIFNKKIGMQLRHKILEKGATRKTLKMLENFLNRKTNNKAFFKIFYI
jgi:Zn-dependent oligopeptidase